jgi:hypothetical protein
LAEQDCPTYPERRAPKTNPQGTIRTNCGPTAQPQFNRQEAMNFLTDKVWNNSPPIYTPENLRPEENATDANLEHLAMPMIHLTTGETITSYKKLMHDPATIEIW